MKKRKKKSIYKKRNYRSVRVSLNIKKVEPVKDVSSEPLTGASVFNESERNHLKLFIKDRDNFFNKKLPNYVLIKGKKAE